MDLNEDGPAARISARHVPAHEQSAFRIEEQFLRWTFDRYSFDNIDITAFEAGLTIQSHALIKALDLACPINIRVALNLRHFFGTLIAECACWSLHPSSLPVETFLQRAYPGKLDHA